MTSKSTKISLHLRADTDRIDRLSVTRASVYADVPYRALDTYCGPATRGEKTGNESLTGLDLNPIASPAFRIGRGAYPREMRRAIATDRRPDWTCVPAARRLRDGARLILEGS